MTLEHTERGGWLQAGADLIFPERDGALSVAWAMIKSPVVTALRLAQDGEYRGYWNFMLSAMGANLAFVYLIVPTAAKILFGAQTPDHTADQLLVQILQLSGFPLLTFAQFYACRALGTADPSPLSYVKLCALSVGFGWILLTAANVVEVMVLAGMVTTGAEVHGNEMDQSAALAGMAAALVFTSLSHQRFWGLSGQRAILITLAIAAVSWGVVYPGLGLIASRSHLSESLKAIFQ